MSNDNIDATYVIQELLNRNKDLIRASNANRGADTRV